MGAEWRSKCAGESHFSGSTCNLQRVLSDEWVLSPTTSPPKHMCPKVIRRYTWGLDATGVPQCHLQPFPLLNGMSNVGKPGITRGQINYFWLLLAAYSLHQNMSALNQSVKQQATNVPKPRATCSQTTELSSTKGSLMWFSTEVACSREFHL